MQAGTDVEPYRLPTEVRWMITLARYSRGRWHGGGDDASAACTRRPAEALAIRTAASRRGLLPKAGSGLAAVNT